MLVQGRHRLGRPPAAKADETRKRIIQAARMVFSERGYDGAGFNAIAARADLTRPAINHYFSSKRTLYRQVINDTNESVIGTSIQQAECETSLLARLTAFIAALVKANTDDPAGPAFLIRGVLESWRHPELPRTDTDSVPISKDFLTRVVNDAVERGEIASHIDASALVDVLLVVILGVGLYAAHIPSDQTMVAATGMLRQLLEGTVSPTSRRSRRDSW